MNILAKAAPLIIIAITSISSCKKNPNSNEPQSSWIEIINRKDTIVFRGDNMLELRLGLELRNAYLLPKIGAGLYTYTSKNDSITLQYTLSSMYAPKNIFSKRLERICLLEIFIKKAEAL